MAVNTIAVPAWALDVVHKIAHAWEKGTPEQMARMISVAAMQAYVNRDEPFDASVMFKLAGALNGVLAVCQWRDKTGREISEITTARNVLAQIGKSQRPFQCCENDAECNKPCPSHPEHPSKQATDKIRNVTDAIEAFIQARIHYSQHTRLSAANDVNETREHLRDKLAELVK